MHSKGSVGFVPNPRTKKRNQCVYDLNPPPDEPEQDELCLSLEEPTPQDQVQQPQEPRDKPSSGSPTE